MKTKALILIGILIVAFAAIVTPVMAATTGTTTITGNPPKTLSLTITGGITGWSLDPTASQPLTDSTNVKMTVATNDRAWVVNAYDAMDGSKTAGTAGKMVQYTPGTPGTYGSISLTNAMLAGATTVNPGFTGSEITLSGVTTQAIATGDGTTSAAGTFSNEPITIKQTVVIADPVLTGTDIYRIIVTFEGLTP